MNQKRPPESEKKVLGSGSFLRLVSENGWEYAERNNATGVVAIVAVTEQNRLILTGQYRTAVHARVIDLPAGLAGDNDPTEELATAAQRELLEETGYEALRMRYLAHGPTSPGLSSEVITFFHAEGVTNTGSGGGGDDTEEIEVLEVALADVNRWLAERADAETLIDPKVYAGLYFAGQSSNSLE